MDALAKLGEMLKHIPQTLVLAVAVAGLFILYGPHVPRLDLSVARKWPWLAPLTFFAAVLFVLRLIEDLIRSYFRVTANNPQRTLFLTVHSERNITWWGANGALTQMVANISAYNPSDRPIRITAVRLVKPKVPALEMQPIMFVVSNDQVRNGSKTNPVPPTSNANINMSILANRKLAEPGTLIRAVIGVMDQHGYEHRVKVKLWPMPPAAHDR